MTYLLSILLKSWSKIAHPLIIKTITKKVKLSIIGSICYDILNNKGRILYAIQKESYKTDDFITELEKIKKEYPNRILNIIWDNLSAHRSKKLIEWAKKNNIKLTFLSPYSPDKNVVELLWNILKQHLAKYVFYSIEELEDMIHKVFKEKIINNIDIFHLLDKVGLGK